MTLTSCCSVTAWTVIGLALFPHCQCRIGGNYPREAESSNLQFSHLVILHSSHSQPPLTPFSLSWVSRREQGSAGPSFLHPELWPQTSSCDQHQGAAEPGLADGERRLFILERDLAKPAPKQSLTELHWPSHMKSDSALVGWGTGESYIPSRLITNALDGTDLVATTLIICQQQKTQMAVVAKWQHPSQPWDKQLWLHSNPVLSMLLRTKMLFSLLSSNPNFDPTESFVLWVLTKSPVKTGLNLPLKPVEVNLVQNTFNIACSFNIFSSQWSSA